MTEHWLEAAIRKDAERRARKEERAREWAESDAGRAAADQKAERQAWLQTEEGKAHLAAAAERRAQKRSAAAKKAAQTRADRMQRRFRLAAGMVLKQINPDQKASGRCFCCGKALGDAVSISRGIGPECWTKVNAFVAEQLLDGGAA